MVNDGIATTADIIGYISKWLTYRLYLVINQLITISNQVMRFIKRSDHKNWANK